MAPRTRGTIQKLAAINAAASQGTEPNGSTMMQTSHHDISNNTTGEKTSQRKHTIARKKSASTPNKSTALFGPKSKLTKIDLGAFFSDDKVWNALTDEQKTILKSACSSSCTWGQNPFEQPTMGLLLYDMHWKSDVRVYEENLKDGCCEQAWIDQARAATAERNEGKFDNWKLEKFEQFWGQKMTERDRDKIEGNHNVSLTDLFIAQQLQISDQWVYSRSFGRGKKMTTVEYEFEMAGVDDHGKTEFRIDLPSRLVATEKRLFSEVVEAQEVDTATAPKAKRVKTSGDSSSREQIDTTQDDSRVSVRFEDDDEQLPESTNQTQRRKSVRRLSSTTSILNTNDKNTKDDLIKSILKKPSRTTVTLKVNGIDHLEQQLLHFDGREQKPGRAESWKYFGIRRQGQEIGSLDDIRQAFQQNHKMQERKTGEFND